MEIPQARITVFPVFPVDVPSLFPDFGNKLKRFPVFSVFAIDTVFLYFLCSLLYRPGTLGTARTRPRFKSLRIP